MRLSAAVRGVTRRLLLVNRSLGVCGAMSSMSGHSLLVEPDEDGLDFAARLLREGGLLAFPTETVYGLGANALNEKAVIDIFKAKGRPLTDPLIVHVANPEDALPLIDISAAEMTVFTTLTTAFWPGPLTVIVNASSKIPMAVTANTGFVGVRCPKHSLAHALLMRAQVPVAAPSANRFGHVSPTRAVHVLADLGEKGVHVLNGESSLLSVQQDASTSCEFGIESTVVKLDETLQQVQVFRQGAITQSQLEKALRATGGLWSVVAVQRTVKMHTTTTHDSSQPVVRGQVAPGQAVTHYAPDVPCYIVHALSCGSSASFNGQHDRQSLPEEHVFMSLSNEDMAAHTVVMDFGGQLQPLKSRVLAYRDLSPSGSSAEAARLLFDTLRWAEAVPNAQRVLVASVQSSTTAMTASTAALSEDKEAYERVVADMSLGLADRVFRAASGVFSTVSYDER